MWTDTARRAAVHRGRMLALIIGLNLATSIEQATDARFVGEPMGGGLNFWNDVRWVRLDALSVPMQVAVSYRHWVFATPDDPRLTIEPEVSIEVTAADYFGGRDPTLEAALSRED